MVGRQSCLFDEDVAYLSGQCETVAAATGDAVARGLLGSGRGAVGAFVEIQQYGTFARCGRSGRGRLGLGRAGKAVPAMARPAPASCRK